MSHYVLYWPGGLSNSARAGAGAATIESRAQKLRLIGARYEQPLNFACELNTWQASWLKF